MPRSTRLAAILALALAVPAPAAFFPGATLDGPNADVLRVGGADLARDGSGTVVYVRRVGGVEHVFAVRMTGGAWSAPEQLDAGLPAASSEPTVGVANDGAAVVTFLNDRTLYATLRRAGSATWSAPAVVATAAAAPVVDLSVNGVGYVVWTSGGDVRAARLDRTGTAFAPLPQPLDIAPEADAGAGTGRPDVAVAADGTALAAWGENGHLYARRLLHGGLSQYPQQLDVADLEAHPGGPADLPAVDTTDDSSFAWVAFRQAFDGGATTRVLARRLVGSAFNPPIAIDGGWGTEGWSNPALDVGGDEDPGSIFASEGAVSHTPFGRLDYIDVLGDPFALSAANAVEARPAVAVGESSQATAAWFDTDTGVPRVVARAFKHREPDGTETALSNDPDGAVDTAGGLHAAADRYGDAIVAFVQGSGTARRLVVATWDRPPAGLVQLTGTRWRRPTVLRWQAVSEPWGPVTYTVSVDDRVLGTTTATSFPIAGRVPDGRHVWSVVATDVRGQTDDARRSLRIDTRPPRLTVRIRGRRAPGALLRFVVDAADRHSGPRSVKVDFGDGSAPAFGSDVSHRFGAGSHTVTFTVTDGAGNRRVETRRFTL